MNTERGFVSWDVEEEVYINTVYDEEAGEYEEVETTEEYVLIAKVFVEKAYRGQGIARRLMEEALAEIQEQHPGLPVRLACEPEAGVDFDLGAFYERLGFEATGVNSTMELRK